MSTDEYCKIGTRVPKYRSTEYFGPKPGVCGWAHNVYLVDHDDPTTLPWEYCDDRKPEVGTIPANMKRWPNVGLLLAHRLRRWPNSKLTLGQRLMND